MMNNNYRISVDLFIDSFIKKISESKLHDCKLCNSVDTVIFSIDATGIESLKNMNMDIDINDHHNVCLNVIVTSFCKFCQFKIKFNLKLITKTIIILLSNSSNIDEFVLKLAEHLVNRVCIKYDKYVYGRIF
jgi:hypothetical protein